MKRINAIELIIDALKESIGPDTDADQAAKINAATEETRLFGSEGLLDSLGVVILLTDLEERLDEDFGFEVSLAVTLQCQKQNPLFVM